MMPSMVIEVESVEMPAPGKKRGRINAVGGMKFQADPSLYNSVQLGGRYNITYEEQSFNNRSFRVAQGVTPSAAPVAAPSAPVGGAGASYPSPRYGNQNLETAERIFVCGALNAALGNPNFLPSNMTEQEILHLVNTLRKTWARTFGAPNTPVAANPTAPKRSVKDFIDDEIPFSGHDENPRFT